MCVCVFFFLRELGFLFLVSNPRARTHGTSISIFTCLLVFLTHPVTLSVSFTHVHPSPRTLSCIMPRIVRYFFFTRLTETAAGGRDTRSPITLAEFRIRARMLEFFSTDQTQNRTVRANRAPRSRRIFYQDPTHRFFLSSPPSPSSNRFSLALFHIYLQNKTLALSASLSSYLQN